MPARRIRAILRPIFCALLLACAPALAQKTIHIPADAATIQAGIDAASTGDTVLVSPGTYYENIDFKGKAITVTSSDGAAKTIIDGGSGSLPTVLFRSKETRASVVSGLTIRGGGSSPQNTFQQFSGGVYSYQSAPTISGNIITANFCQGVVSNTSAPLIQGNTISATIGNVPNLGYCLLDRGPAILIYGATFTFGDGIVPAIIGNTIENNLEGIYGSAGGVYLWSGERTLIQNNVFRNNAGTQGGAIASANTDTVSIIQNLFYGNHGGGAGAIYLLPPGSSIGPFIGILSGNTFADNVVTYGKTYDGDSLASQVYLSGNLAQYVVVNNIIAGNVAGTAALNCDVGYKYLAITPLVFDHNDIYAADGISVGGSCPDQTGSYGNINANPLFVNSSAGDYRLRAGSPAIDAGNNSAPLLTAVDLDGKPRLQDATGLGYNRIDLGAYEFSGVSQNGGTYLTLAPSTYTPFQYNDKTPFTLTANITSALGIPSGPITFYEDGTSVGVVNLDASGKAVLQPPVPTPGLHAFIATYPGQNAMAPAVSVKFYVLFPKTSPTLTLTSSQNPSFLGTAVTFTVKIVTADGSSPGPITLTDSSIGNVLATLTPDATGTAVFTTSSLVTGSHSIIADFAADATHTAASASLTQIVKDPNATAITATFSPNICIAGTTTTFTATVTSVSGAIPTGSVSFGGTAINLGVVALDATGHATLTAPFSFLGPYPLEIDYLPTGSFSPSRTILTMNCTAGYPTTTTLTASPNPALFGTTVTFSAAVTSANGTPTGNIQFSESATILGTFPIDSIGHATFATSSLAVGTHSITATYQPTGTFAGSSSVYVETIQGITNTIGLTSSANPSDYGASITLTAIVASNSSTAGTVTFYNGSNVIGQTTTTAANSLTSLIVPGSGLTVGSNTLRVVFAPTNGSTTATASLTQIVNGLPSITTLTATPGTGVAFTNSITLTATVAPATPGGPTPIGSVLFYNNAGQLSFASLVNGVATLTTTLPVGTNHLYAVYSPGTGSLYTASTSNITDVTITAAPSALTLTSSGSPSFAFQPVTFTAQLTVNGQPAASGLAVQFTILTGPLTVVTTASGTTNAAGVATFSSAGLPAGTYLVTAAFAGNASVLPASASVVQTVMPLITATSLSITPNPAYENQLVTFTLHVSTALSAPGASGTVAIFDSTLPGQSLTYPVTQGNVTFTLNNLSVGTHDITAHFTPADTSYTLSNSNTVSLIVAPQTFTVTVSDSNPSIATGHHRAVTVSINSIGGLTAPFTLACGSNLPQWTSCQWAQSTLTLPANGTVSTSLTLDTNQLPGFLTSSIPSQRPPFWNIRFAALPVFLLAFYRRRNLRANLPRLLMVFVFFTAASFITACGANKYPYSTAPGTYSIPLIVTEHPTTAGSSTVTKTVTVTLTVTN